MKKLFNLLALLLIIGAVLWIVFTSPEIKESWDEAKPKFEDAKDAWDNSTDKEAIVNWTEDNLNADTVGQRIKDGVDWTKDRIEPVIDYAEDVYENVTDKEDSP